MIVKRAIHLVLWIIGSLTALALLVLVVTIVGCSNSYWWDRDQWNQEKIAKAYIAFCADKTNYPSNLADLVKTGYLPEKASWYKEPPGLFARPVDFTESCYIVQPPESGNPASLKMIGRRAHRDGKEEVHFEPMENATVRDGLIFLPLRLKFAPTNTGFRGISPQANK